ncbi:MAG: Stealth CR1 domain-containing protein [Chitinispirillia bacterium]|nr:Stealth CR1 domain-containing protein [Chitinispirillia bacterium]
MLKRRHKRENLEKISVLPNSKIDMLYLWVDGSDEKWLAKKNAELSKIGGSPDDAGVVRYEDNDELLFSLRSVEKFAPWINRIFIVTDNQTPKWLNLNNPKISIVDHTEIMPREALPCFNSSVIEFFIPNIKNLSQHFIYANDDTLFMAKSKPDYFFSKNGVPIVRVNSGKKILRKTAKELFPAGERFKTLWEKSGLYDCKKLNSRKLLYEMIGEYNCPWQESHIMDPYRKSDLLEIVNMPLVKETLKNTMTNHFRSRHDIHRSLFHLFGVVKFGYKTVKNNKWTHIKQLLTFRFRDMPCFAFNIKLTMRRRPVRRKVACINDPEDAKIRESNHDYLAKMFPDKSKFEK